MPAMTDLLVYDDAPTPAEFVFEPISDSQTTAVWRTNSTGVPEEGQKRLSLLLEKVKGGKWKSSAKLEVPVMESVGASNALGYVSAPKVAHTVVTIITQYSSSRATTQDRANSLKMAVGLLAANNVTTTSVPYNTVANGGFVTTTRLLLKAFISLVKPN
jgi:hypothetical protein